MFPQFSVFDKYGHGHGQIWRWTCFFSVMRMLKVVTLISKWRTNQRGKENTKIKRFSNKHLTYILHEKKVQSCVLKTESPLY